MPPECRLATGDVSDGLPIAVDDVTKSCRYFPCASPPPDAFNRSVSRVQPAAPRRPIRTSAAGRTGAHYRRLRGLRSIVSRNAVLPEVHKGNDAELDPPSALGFGRRWR
jgi:hypothetical protein